MRYYVAVLVILAIFVAPWFGVNYPVAADTILTAISSVGEQIAAVILARKPVTVEQLKSDYALANIPGNK